MNPETLQQLKDEIQQKLLESVNNADLYSVLEKYGVVDDRVLKIQWHYTLDPNKIKSGDAIDEQQQIEVMQDSWCIPCPSTGSPLGCYC